MLRDHPIFVFPLGILIPLVREKKKNEVNGNNISVPTKWKCMYYLSVYRAEYVLCPPLHTLSFVVPTYSSSPLVIQHVYEATVVCVARMLSMMNRDGDCTNPFSIQPSSPSVHSPSPFCETCMSFLPVNEDVQIVMELKTDVASFHRKYLLISRLEMPTCGRMATHSE